MSVNTPKRPKTAFYPNIDRESEMFDPTCTTHWSWPASADCSAAPSAATLNTVSSPSSSCGSPEVLMNDGGVRTPSTTKDHHRDNLQFPTPTHQDGGLITSSGGREHKRGRPRSESLTNLMIEGSTSPSAIKCKFCNRVFPREKSLAAHLRTHTGERPYVCDYPGCTKSFTQSGQMKTHQRLHTGERPFICAVPACEMRFTHANRHCPVHINAVLKRDDKFVVKMTPEQNEEVLLWLQKYRAEREDKSTPTRKTPQRSRITPGKSTPASASLITSTQKENLPHTPVQDRSTYSGGQVAATKGNGEEDEEEDEFISSSTGGSCSSSNGGVGGGGLKRHPQNDENECPMTPTTPSKNNPYKSRKGLMTELDMNAGLAMSPLAPLKMKPQPKQIQWQEPLSQGEEEEEEEDELGGVCHGQRLRNYYLNEQNHHHHHPLTQSPRRLKEKENRGYHSPSKKNALRQNGNSPASTFNPKKKWLREACMEDLAKPLDVCGGDGNSVLGSPQKLQIKSMNLLRPTVLMLASKDKLIPLNGNQAQPAQVQVQPPEVESNRSRWLGKMALMQLATEEAAAEKRAREERTASGQGHLVTGAGGGSGGDLPEYTQL